MKLYKFQSVNDNSISSLTDLSLYFSDSKQLNDPTESIFKLLDLDVSDKYSPDISNLENIGILSMAIESGDVKVDESPFMWAHYGDELKGFCLVFDYELLLKTMKSDSLLYDRVEYLKYPRIISGSNLINEKSGLEEVAGCEFKNQNSNRVFKTCFFSKPLEFINEREFRFIAESKGGRSYSSDSLLSIIIGDKMKKPQRERLLNTVSSLGIDTQIKFARTKNNSFKIHIECSEYGL